MLDAATDTHGLIWYLEDSPRLNSSARAVFDACDQGEIVVYIPIRRQAVVAYYRRCWH